MCSCLWTVLPQAVEERELAATQAQASHLRRQQVGRLLPRCFSRRTHTHFDTVSCPVDLNAQAVEEREKKLEHDQSSLLQRQQVCGC